MNLWGDLIWKQSIQHLCRGIINPILGWVSPYLHVSEVNTHILGDAIFGNVTECKSRCFTPLVAMYRTDAVNCSRVRPVGPSPRRFGTSGISKATLVFPPRLLIRIQAPTIDPHNRFQQKHSSSMVLMRNLPLGGSLSKNLSTTVSPNRLKAFHTRWCAIV